MAASKGSKAPPPSSVAALRRVDCTPSAFGAEEAIGKGGVLDLARFRPAIETQELPESGSDVRSQDTGSEWIVHTEKPIYPQISQINADLVPRSGALSGAGSNLRKSVKSVNLLELPELPESGCNSSSQGWCSAPPLVGRRKEPPPRRGGTIPSPPAARPRSGARFPAEGGVGAGRSLAHRVPN